VEGKNRIGGELIGVEGVAKSPGMIDCKRKMPSTKKEAGDTNAKRLGVSEGKSVGEV